MSFCEQLRKRREELGLSRTELAERLGVSLSAVGNYENGVSAPKEGVLLRLFDALEVDPNYLYRGSFRSGGGSCSDEASRQYCLHSISPSTQKMPTSPFCKGSWFT